MSIYDKRHPVVDIVVLTYNNRAIIERFLSYLYKHTKDFKLYIVDNNSKDDTVKFLKSKNHDNMMLIENYKNSGVAGGRTLGIKAGRSNYVLCLDSDQFVYSGWMEELFAIHNLGFDLAGVESWIMTSSKNHRPYFPTKRCETKFDRGIYIGGGSTLVPRKIFEELNYFDENYFIFFEDSDFSFAASKKGYKLAWHYGNKILHLGHQTIGKNSSKTKYFQDSYKYFVKKWMPYFPRPINALILERMLPEVFNVKGCK